MRRLFPQSIGDPWTLPGRAAGTLCRGGLGCRSRHQAGHPRRLVEFGPTGKPRIDDHRHAIQRQRSLGNCRSENDAPAPMRITADRGTLGLRLALSMEG